MGCLLWVVSGHPVTSANGQAPPRGLAQSNSFVGNNVVLSLEIGLVSSEFFRIAGA